MPKARLFFDGDNSGIEKEARIYSLTQEVEDKLDSISDFQDEIDGLQDQINNLASRGRYLSTWDCVTGLPGTDPQVDPYVYRAGDYYIVSNVGGTNLRPAGAEYHVQVPSQVVESQSVSQNDLYIYDGIQWVLQGSGSSLLAVWGSITGTLSAQTDLQNALDAKANKTDVLEKTNTTSYTPTADYNPATKKYVDDEIANIDLSTKQDKLTAGDNIQISNTNVISATDTTYNAGENITIEDICTTESDMKGPCPSGFHVPTNGEWQNVINIWTALGGGSSDGTNFGIALKLPFAGKRNADSTASIAEQGTNGYYRTPNIFGAGHSIELRISSSQIVVDIYQYQTRGNSIRAFKNSPVVPDATWTKLYGVSVASGGIFWSSADGLISLSSNGSTWITMQDKNLGATQVWNDGDTLSESNCGGYFQRGNNYMFPYTGNVTVRDMRYIPASDRINVTGYGPGNYYYSSDFIDTNYMYWCTPEDPNLRGGQTQGTFQDCIYNVISAEDTTYTAGSGTNIDQNNEISVDTTVIATQTDLQNGLDEKQDELTAGDNITIEDICTTESDMKGPCPSGFHIPLATEWQAVYDVWTALGGGADDGDNFGIALKIPKPGYRFSSWGSVINQGTYGYYWSSSRYGSNKAYSIYVHSSILNPQYTQCRANGFSVRCFSNSPVIPTSTWTKLYGASIENGGIFWSATDGLISLSSDGQIWITMQDKNLGATTVWNSGDAFTEANCGKFYQWGNNYGFPLTGNVSISSTQVDASTYGPGNYYSSDTFITGDSWDSSNNRNLRGGETQGTFQDCIHNVISATDTTYTAGTGLNLSNGEFSVDTTTIATKADIANLGTFVVVDTLPTAASADEKTIYLLGPIGTGADKYEEWIITRDYDWASSSTLYPFTVNRSTWDGAIFIDSQTSPLSDFHGDCYVGAKLTSIGDETKLPVKLSFRASSSVDSEWVGLNEPAFAYNPDQYPNGDDLDIYIPNTSSSNSVSITAEGVMSSSPITWELGPKQWTKIGETSIDLSTKQDVLIPSTGISIDSSNNISNTLPGAIVSATAPSNPTEGMVWYDTTNDSLKAYNGTSWETEGTKMVVLKYGISTWQDFLDAYNKNALVYCKVSSGSSGYRMAFMAYTAGQGTPTEVEFQYYRSRSSHSQDSTQLDEVYVYKLTNAGVWSTATRDTGAKITNGTGISISSATSSGVTTRTISADTAYIDSHGAVIPVYYLNGGFSSDITFNIIEGGEYSLCVKAYHSTTADKTLTLTVDGVTVGTLTSNLIEHLYAHINFTASAGSTAVLSVSSTTNFQIEEVYMEKINIQSGYLTATVN